MHRILCKYTIIPSIFLLSYSSVETWYVHTVNYNEAPSAADEELVSSKATLLKNHLHYVTTSLPFYLFELNKIQPFTYINH